MSDHINLELVLVVLTLITGLIIFFNWWTKRTVNSNIYKKHTLPFLLTGPLWVLYHFFTNIGKQRDGDSLIVEYAKSFFPVLLLVLVIRSFIAEPFRIPSGSMIPTLEIGDFILVKKYAYGIRLPVLKTKIIETGQPKRGDVVVFRYPKNPDINYIKRLIGLPGDHIKWTRDKKLIINGIEVDSRIVGQYQTKSRIGSTIMVDKLEETLPDDEAHEIISFSAHSKSGEWKVPARNYFMMGDNRDNSSDGRVWGFVPEENLVGKASLVWMHWNWLDGGDGFQASRIGTTVD